MHHKFKMKMCIAYICLIVLDFILMVVHRHPSHLAWMAFNTGILWLMYRSELKALWSKIKSNYFDNDFRGGNFS